MIRVKILYMDHIDQEYSAVLLADTKIVRIVPTIELIRHTSGFHLDRKYLTLKRDE